ncbi:MAG TPA: hypothetical protein VH000_08830 [Rhizomicrobium sp.]|jgi:hypothetical protein|nr:hypothetical protein [Rhizomicrobium sp.]
MAGDRSVRNLGALRGASTSRVLNLSAVRKAHGEEPEYRAAPLFDSPIINSALILKHRVRGDESYLFDTPHNVATKVIVPFDMDDLKLGGRSFFYGQRGFRDAMRQIGNYNPDAMQRDLEVLRLISTVPSLDPFLLREHLRFNDINVADCYFEISAADKVRMSEFVATDIRHLIHLAFAKGAGASSSTAKLVSALLSTAVDEKLEPMRITLMLDGEQFREGVFSWRGFLYYKWSMNQLWPGLGSAIQELKTIRASGVQTNEQLRLIAEHKKRVILAILRARQDVAAAVKNYDDAYSDLVEHGKPATFRDFLLKAPAMFITLGERVGTISHIVSFWQYRFGSRGMKTADADELIAIFNDFESGFNQQEAAPAHAMSA